jgi:DnaJ family protein C protein 11
MSISSSSSFLSLLSALSVYLSPLSSLSSGLIIVMALYGSASELDGDNRNNSEKVIDVVIALQHLVDDSKLVLHSGSKKNLEGFYDCAVGEQKQLFIRYLFLDKLHQVTIDDDEPLSLPLRSHLVQ